MLQELQKDIALKQKELSDAEQDCKKVCQDEPKDKAKALKLQLKTVQDDTEQIRLNAQQQHDHLLVSKLDSFQNIQCFTLMCTVHESVVTVV